MQNSKHYTLIGAGLVGSLLAKQLADLGHEITIYERRPDPRREEISAGRSINLALSTRGIHALKSAGLGEKILARTIPMLGRMVHPVQGELSFQRYGKDDSEYISSVSRQELNQVLMTEAEKTGRVKIHFKSRVTGADFSRKVIQVESAGATAEKGYDLLIGTDGSGSAVRKELSKLSQYRESEDILNYGYKELTIPAGPHGSFRLEKNALHIWPRGNYMLIALPNFDGSFTCTLFLSYRGPISFENVHSPAQVGSFFAEHFPDVIPHIPNLFEEFETNPVGQMVTLKTSPWYYREEVLLIGDAVHAIVPFFGQGMNCGFEDCSELLELLKEDSSQPVFESFFRKRKANTDAIAEMAADNFIEMRDKVADPKFLFAKSVEKILQAEFPKNYRSRYSLVTFSRVPYRIAFEAGRIGDEILAELSRGLSEPKSVDLKLASQLIQTKLDPFLGPWLQKE